jgi:hypothetical protein
MKHLMEMDHAAVHTDIFPTHGTWQICSQQSENYAGVECRGLYSFQMLYLHVWTFSYYLHSIKGNVNLLLRS